MKIKYVITSLILVLWMGNLSGQEIVSSGGEFFRNNSFSISCTLGESVIETLGTTDITLTQGFQQSYLIITSRRDHFPTEIEVSVYPNPTTDRLNLSVSGKDNQALQYRLIDMMGRVLLTERIKNPLEEIDMQGYASGYYTLAVSNQRGSTINAFRIIKN